MNIVILDGYTLNPGDNPWGELAVHGELTVFDRTAPERVVGRGRLMHEAAENLRAFLAGCLRNRVN
jgi:hypothetical protein